MKMIVSAVAALFASVFLLGGCGDDSAGSISAATSSKTSTTTEASSPDDVFGFELSHVGIVVGDDLYRYIPAAHSNCDTMDSLANASGPGKLPESALFDKVVDLVMLTGKFADRESANGFVAASIRAYCPQYIVDLPGVK